MKNLLSVDLYEYMTLDRSKREIRLHRVEIRDEVEGLGAPEVPGLQKSTVGKMGLKGVKGLVVIPDPPRAHHGRGGGEGRSAGSGGRGSRGSGRTGGFN